MPMIQIYQDPDVRIAALRLPSADPDPRESLLREITGDAIVKIEKDSRGRPFLRDAKWNLSISHSADLLAIAICEKPLSVGLDVEPVLRVFDFKLFIEYALTDQERTALPRMIQATGWSEREVVLAYWTLKEAVFKATETDFAPRAIELGPPAELRQGMFCFECSPSEQRAVRLRCFKWRDHIVSWGVAGA